MSKRADFLTQTTKQEEFYSDFLMNLDKNPISGEISRSTNEKAVIRSIRNLISTNRGERLLDPTIGCDVRGSLFEFGDDVTADVIKTNIHNTISIHEPRAILKQLSVLISEDQDTCRVDIVLSLINTPADLFSFTVVLKRTR